MKPRVLLLSTVHPPTDPRIVSKIAPWLVREGYEVWIALPKITKPPVDEGYRTIRLPQFRYLWARLLCSFPVVLLRCLWLRPKILHIFVPELLPLAWLFHWMGSVVIYEVQENLYYKLSLKRYNNAPLFQLLFRWFDRAARHTFRLVITEAAYRTTYAETRYPPVLIRNFASIALLDRLADAKRPALITPGPVLYYSGVISMERAFDTLVRAVVLLLPELPTLQVHLFGTLRMTVAEREQLPDYDRVRSHLVFYGYTTQEVMLPYAKYALAGIALLKPVGDYPDSYPTKLFDYMALGLPVITSDFPLYKEVVETHDCGFCIDPTDAEALAGAVRRLVREESLARRMGQNGRAAAVEHYHWEQEARRLSELYAICLGKA